MTEQLCSCPFAMSQFATVTKNKIACICMCHLPHISVDKIVQCAVSSLQGIQMLIAAQSAIQGVLVSIGEIVIRICDCHSEFAQLSAVLVAPFFCVLY